MEVQHTHKVKTEQQPDGSWKAWAEGTASVAYDRDKLVAIRKVVRMILGNTDQSTVSQDDQRG